MTEGVVPTSSPADAPDWSTIQREILCPLCDYNLRGLIEPRCPECGHSFGWADLLDWSLHQHPWLFEHQRRRRIQLYLRTFLTNLLPRCFYRSVKATHPPNLRRLVLYWFISVAIVLPIVLGTTAVALADDLAGYYRNRSDLIKDLRRNLNRNRPLLQRYGSPEAAVAAYYPVVPGAEWWRRRLERALGSSGTIALRGGVICLLWPWATFVSLQVFRQSMRATRLKGGHVLRCAIYSVDSGLMLAIPLAIVLSAILEEPLEGIAYYDIPLLSMVAMCMLVFGYRLCVAYRSYLAFPHAIPAALASQLVAAGTILALYVGLLW